MAFNEDLQDKADKAHESIVNRYTIGVGLAMAVIAVLALLQAYGYVFGG